MHPGIFGSKMGKEEQGELMLRGILLVLAIILMFVVIYLIQDFVTDHLTKLIG